MSTNKIETFQIGNHMVPRLFVGLWQCSSPLWGSAPLSKIKKHFQALVDAGFTAYDMADHYGDAELLFGRFRSKYAGPEKIYCATKICLFEQVDPTSEVMDAALAQRVKNVKADSIDLCQFYIQHYANGEHLKALKYLDNDARVSSLGAVNFDTAKMEQAIDAGIAIATNQVQFSLIDSRPTVKMGPLCAKHGVKLLTYGTLCGGFLADKWLGEPVPAMYSDGMTPSHRKYFEEIEAWGGWSLFQSLLQALKLIADKHGVSVSNVATRWVLDHEYVGAVIVGTRLGISDRTNENLKVYGWRLDDEDQQRVEEVLAKSRRSEMFEQMGDCGMEYIH
ncbi:putative general stress protein [Phyllosticta capitalensis]